MEASGLHAPPGLFFSPWIRVIPDQYPGLSVKNDRYSSIFTILGLLTEGPLQNLDRTLLN